MEGYELVIYSLTSFLSCKDCFESASLLATLEGKPWFLLICQPSLLPWSSLGWNLMKGEAWTVNTHYFVRGLLLVLKCTALSLRSQMLNYLLGCSQTFRFITCVKCHCISARYCLDCYEGLCQSISSSTQIHLRTYQNVLNLSRSPRSFHVTERTNICVKWVKL